MQLAQRVWVDHCHLGRKRTRAYPSAFFKLEQIAAIPQDGAFFQPFENSFLFHACSWRQSSTYSYSALIGLFSANRSGRNALISTVFPEPSSSSSLIASPMAGEILNPIPENPAHT